jgi:hypothetical protein
MPDHWHIDLAQPWHVRFWTREFGVTEEELREGVGRVGRGVGDLRAHFERR